MMGTASNDRADVFWQADVGEAAALLTDVIREVRPQVLVTYNEFGGYGHPDHIQAHRVAMCAVELAADPGHGSGAPHRVSKVYWNTVPRSVIERSLQAVRAKGAAAGFTAVASIDDLPFVEDDSAVTTVIDAEAFVAQKAAAMRAHATQIRVGGSFFALSNGLGMEISGVEYYKSVRGAIVGARPERDLFAGLDGDEGFRRMNGG
jgi:N-acetyl-1-D-myo-inositol-2-amino-2-deoxy-alpha-D-glucopyranoside deacetylase